MFPVFFIITEVYEKGIFRNIKHKIMLVVTTNILFMGGGGFGVREVSQYRGTI
jgi:hypothetical protein